MNLIRLGSLAAILLASASGFASEEKISFNRDIRPVLSNACFACHGFDAKERKADLRLDTRDGAFADLGGYAAIVPKDPGASEAWQRILSDDEDEMMPPPDFHKKLSDDEKALLRRWIEEGAEYQAHWSFVAPVKVEATGAGEEKNAIDRFLLNKLKKRRAFPCWRGG